MFRNPFSSSSPASKSTRNSVLFVGNDGSDLALRKQLLESSGFSVVTAPSSEDGLNLFMSKPVDAVVVDSSLPGERA
ncbi:MAG TPA: response regulator, partial [Terriglobales bacterium]|nr:response regulator [Terriglobales bacterium]